MFSRLRSHPAPLAFSIVVGCTDGGSGADADAANGEAPGSGGFSSTGGTTAAGGFTASGGASAGTGGSGGSSSSLDASPGGSGSEDASHSDATTPGDGVLRPFGVGSHWNEMSKYAAMREAGVQILRVDFEWYQLEPTQGNFTWSNMDAALQEAEAQGLEVLGVVGYTNEWASSGDSHQYAPREEFDDEWGNFVQQVVGRYGDTVDAWEIWNEPDHDNFLRMGAGTWAENHHSSAIAEEKKRLEYEHLIDIALSQPALAGKKITTSGFAEGGGFDEGFRTWLESRPGFLNQFDVASFHTYGYPSYQRLVDLPVSYRETQSAIGKDPWPFWITEHGINTTGVDAGTVKTYLIRSYAVALAQSGVEKLFWFRAGYDPGHMDLFDASSNTTDAYDAYQTLTAHWTEPTRVEAWASSGSAAGSIATLSDGNRVAIVWDDDNAPGIATLGFNVQAVYDQDGDTISTDSVLGEAPLFLLLND